MSNLQNSELLDRTGDLLDMRTNDVQAAFIQGRQVDLANKQTHLNEKYKTKYGIK